MAKEPKDKKWRIGELMPSELFADMPRWGREMKRNFGDLCTGEDKSRPGWSESIRESAANLSKEKDERKQENISFNNK